MERDSISDEAPRRPLVQTILYLHKQLERAADAHEMTTGQYFLLHFLRTEPRRASDFRLASKLRKPGITSLVARLEEKGWIERAPDPDDGRAQIIRITEAGLHAFHDFEAHMQQALEQFLGEAAVRETDALIEPFFEHWNARRVERFHRLRRGRGNEDVDTDVSGPVAGRGRTRS